MNRYCTKCGNPLNENDRFCSKCGTECKVESGDSYIVSEQMKPRTIWTRFISLPIWLKFSYLFIVVSFLFFILYSLSYSHHYNYYIDKNAVQGFVTCYDDLKLIEIDGYSVSYFDVKDTTEEIQDAEDSAKGWLDNRFEDIRIQTLSTILCLILIHIIIIKLKSKIKITKYKQCLYIIIFITNLISPYLIYSVNTDFQFYRSHCEKVSKSFLSDIPAIIEYAHKHDLKTEGHFRDLKPQSTGSQISNSVEYNNNNVQESVYYEDVPQTPNSYIPESNSSYDQSYNERQTEYKEPCGLCGGDGKCYNARARSLAEMEMYCNGTGSCPQCHGKTYVNNSYEGIDSPMKCTYCNGTGICPKCHGTKVCNACHGRGH